MAPKKLKPYVVDRVDDYSTKTKVDILLDREAKDFFAVIGLEEVRAPTAKECAKLARAELYRQRQFSWKKMIEVRTGQRYSHHETDDSRDADLMLSFERFEQTQKADGTLLERPYRSPAEDAKETAAREGFDPAKPFEAVRVSGPLGTNEKLRGDDVSTSHRTGSLLPYSDEAWTTLLRLKKTINEVRKKLEELLSQKNIEANLAKALLTMGGGALVVAPKAPTKKCERGGMCKFVPDLEHDPVDPPWDCTKCHERHTEPEADT